jgi:hypothetical protein
VELGGSTDLDRGYGRWMERDRDRRRESRLGGTERARPRSDPRARVCTAQSKLATRAGAVWARAESISQVGVHNTWS